MAQDLRLVFGPMLFGVFINLILYGILLVQVSHYYVTCKTDKPWIKHLVLFVFIVETVNTACDMHIIYQPVVERFGLSEAAEYFPTLFATQVITIVAISTPIQLFFSWRVWLFTKSMILTAIIAALSLASMAGAIWTSYIIIKIRYFSRFRELHTPALFWLLTTCTTDVLITTVLVFSLKRQKRRFVATGDVTPKIIHMIVPTGLLTAVFALGDVILFLAPVAQTTLNFIFDIPLPKLYSNCLLSTLNTRSSLQYSIDYQSDSAPQANALAMTPLRNHAFSSESMPPPRDS